MVNSGPWYRYRTYSSGIVGCLVVMWSCYLGVDGSILVLGGRAGLPLGCHG